LTPEVDEPVAAGVDPLPAAVPELAIEAVELGAEPEVEVTKPDAEVGAAADGVEDGGMMAIDGMLVEEELVATGEELATGDWVGATVAVDDETGALLPDGSADPVEPPDEPVDEPAPIPFTAAQVPVKPVPGCEAGLGVVVTSGPGLGKTTSMPSIVVHPFARFATNKSGREEKAAVLSLLLDPPLATVIDAQFM
jgi:hypothetical protein